MKITEMKTSTFWKGELGVQASVEDAGNHYEISLFVKGSQLNGYSSSCVKTGLKKYVMCEHEKFVWKGLAERTGDQEWKTGHDLPGDPHNDSEYTNREVAQIVQEGEVRGICLIPRLILKRDGETSLEFKIGRDRTYVVKDLAEFVHAV
ncbi:MAG: ATP-dependent helicase, partial [Lachnospiraceae bacterium]